MILGCALVLRHRRGNTDSHPWPRAQWCAHRPQRGWTDTRHAECRLRTGMSTPPTRASIGIHFLASGLFRMLPGDRIDLHTLGWRFNFLAARLVGLDIADYTHAHRTERTAGGLCGKRIARAGQDAPGLIAVGCTPPGNRRRRGKFWPCPRLPRRRVWSMAHPDGLGNPYKRRISGEAAIFSAFVASNNQ